MQWSAEEDAILNEYYPGERMKACQRIPNRSNESCQRRVSKLGIFRAKATDCDDWMESAHICSSEIDPHFEEPSVERAQASEGKSGCTMEADAPVGTYKKFSRKKKSDEIQSFIAAYPQASPKEIAGKYGCSIQTIYNIKKRMGLSTKRLRKVDPDKLREYLTEYPKASLIDVANHFNCAVVTVSAAKNGLV